MKKRLLITSIVMMLVVAVALSTATYAWFTSNVQVTANTITMTAGTSQSSALGIQWSKGPSGATFNAHYTTDIDSVAPASIVVGQAGGFQPAAPLLLDTISTHAAPVFYTQFVNAQGEFQDDGAETTVYRFANNADDNAQNYSNVIHIANLAQSGDQTLYLTATITQHFVAIDTAAVNDDETVGEKADPTNYTYYDADKVALVSQPTAGANLTTAGYKVEKAKDGTALVRIAVYEVSGTNYATYTYKGLLSKTAAVDADQDEELDPNTVEGEIESGNAASALLTACSTTELNLGTIAAQSDKAYAIYVWLDGAAFDEAQSLKTADIALNFSTAKTSNGTVTEINAPQA